MQRHFVHSGDLGDVVYSLPAVKAMGGGTLWLLDMPGVRTMHGMTRQRFEAIRPLLARQPYIDRVYAAGDVATFSDGDVHINLNAFRSRPCDLYREWLPNHYLDTLGIDRGVTAEPWLIAEPALIVPPVLIARSARYHNPRFPWRRVMDQYRGYARFVGTPAEHAAFCMEFGDIGHLHTPDLFKLARHLSGALLFIGNQSCPLAIAEGLKKPIVCEVCPQCPNCNSPRRDFVQGWDENVILPDLEELYAVRERGPAPLLPREQGQAPEAGRERVGVG